MVNVTLCVDRFIREIFADLAGGPGGVFVGMQLEKDLQPPCQATHLLEKALTVVEF